MLTFSLKPINNLSQETRNHGAEEGAKGYQTVGEEAEPEPSEQRRALDTLCT